MTVTVTVRATSAGAGQSITNTATAGSSADTTPANNSDDATVTVTSADLGVTKTIAPNPPVAGAPVTFQIVARNDGPSDATGVVVRDPLPAQLLSPTVSDDGGATCSITSGELLCDIGDLDAGQTVTIEVSGTMAGGATSITNSAAIDGSEPDPDPTDDTTTVVVDVEPSADLSLIKTSDPTSAAPGDEVVWTLTVTNDGPSTATAATITDTLPAGVTFVSSPTCTNSAGTVTCLLGDIPDGEQRVATIRVQIQPGAPSTVTNTAAVTSPVDDPDPTDNDDDASVSVQESADLSVEKVADLASAEPGDTITYTLTVHNDGPDTAQNVTLSDTIPSGLAFVSSTPGPPDCTESGGALSCAFGDIPAGGTRIVTVTATVQPIAPPLDHQHALNIQRVQQDLTLAPGQTGSVDVACPTGYFATDASVLILDNAGNVDASIVPDAVQHNGDGYRAIVTNPTTQGNIQTRVSVVCLGSETQLGGNPHTHDLLVSAPVSRTEALGTGTYAFDLQCGPGQVPVAPSFTFTGDEVRVRGSFHVGANTWRFVLDSMGGATADLAIRCLDTQTGDTDGHSHTLDLNQHDRTATIQPGQTQVERVECGPDGKGIVASFDIDPGLVSLGNEPQPVNRDFRLDNPTDSPLDARLGLLCLGDRTGDPADVTEWTNTASVSSVTPDPDADDRTDSATVARTGAPAPFAPGPAPLAPGPNLVPPDPEPSAPPGGTNDLPGTSGGGTPGTPGTSGTGPSGAPLASFRTMSLRGTTLLLLMSCRSSCAGTASIKLARTVRAGRVVLRRGQRLARASFRVRPGRRATLRLKLSRSTAAALRRAKVRSVLVELRGLNGKTSTVRVALRG